MAIECCPGCAAVWGPYKTLVGFANCHGCSGHRTQFCRTCESTFYFPPFGPDCRVAHFDNR